MNKYEVDVAVLLIFFNRPDTTKQVFEQIRKTRPSKLFLYQDGAREERDDDVENIARCRKIVEEVDWECEIYRCYQKDNFGCDPSEYLAIRWMFEYVDRGIILEDDDVPAVSFFRFCKELLDRYAEDESIAAISGMNHLDEWKPKGCKADYFFAHGSSIWGWATWKRFVDLWDAKYSFLDSPEKIQRMKQNFLESKTMRSDRVTFSMYLEKCREHRAVGKEFYETLVASTRILNNQMTIFPTKNMISNIGFSGERTHGSDELRALPKVSQRVYNIKRHELEGNLRHPLQVAPSDVYIFKKESLMTASYFNYPFRWLEAKLRRRLYGNKCK